MKQLLSILLALVMVLTMAACGTETAAPVADTSALESEIAALQEQVAALQASQPAAPAEEPTEEDDEAYSMARKALDQQEIQNLMSWHVMYHCYGLHREEMEEIWVQEPENQATASFGQNQGFYVGYDAIWEAYVEGHDTSWLSTAKSYCETNNIDISGMTDEEVLEKYGGVGQLLLHVTTTAIIEVAEDGQTAKCFWYSPGMIAETGQSANTIWEIYGVDFVKENGEWKMWHLHMFTDFMGSFYLTLGGNSGMGGGAMGGAPPMNEDGTMPEPPAGGPGGPGGPGGAPGGEQQQWQGEGGAQVAASTANAYLSSVQYTEFSQHRLREEMEIFLPEPYESWNFEDENYGPTKAELESYDIDLDAWYAAH